MSRNLYPYPVVKTDKTQAAYVRYLTKSRRMRRIGKGAFASAYASKSGRTIVKVGIVREGTWCDHANTQYLRYLKLIERYKNNPLFPKISSVEIFEHERTGNCYMVVEMERLKRMVGADSNVGSLIGYICEDEETFQASKRLFGKIGKHLEQVHKVLYKLLEKHGASLDLHDENVMMRSKNQFVITDPVC